MGKRAGQGGEAVYFVGSVRVVGDMLADRVCHGFAEKMKKLEEIAGRAGRWTRIGGNRLMN